MMRILLIGFLLLIANHSFGQTAEVDSLFLTDGTVLTGRILNPESNSTIRIRNQGGAILYINESRISRMVLSEFREAQAPNVEGPPAFQEDKIAIAMQFGTAIPFGDFSSVTSPSGGFASIGWYGQMSLWVKIAEHLYWSNRLTYTRNSINEPGFERLNSNLIGVEFTKGLYTPWVGWHFQTGLSYLYKLDNDLSFYFEGHLGFSRFTSPRVILFTNDLQVFRLESVVGAGFNSSIGASVIYKERYTLSLNLIRSNPLFVFSGMQSSTIVQPFRVVSLGVGMLLFPSASAN
ncbi:MAG: hypothetical protein WED33_03355 [Bacteroidia bacterium]